MAVILNGESFSLNDFRGLGHSTILSASYGRPQEARFPDRIFAQMLTELEAAGTATGDAEAAATAAEAARDVTLGYKNNTQNLLNSTTTVYNNTVDVYDDTVIAKNVAVAAATSSQFPFYTTGGTSTAYTITSGSSPTPPTGDAFAFRANFHVACGANPTLNYDGQGALELVDGQNLSAGGAYRSLDANDIFIGMNLILMKDTSFTPDKWVIVGGFPIYELSRDLNANGYDIKNLRGYTYQVTASGNLRNEVSNEKIYFPRPARVYGLKRKVGIGSINAQFSKNGSQVISFTDSPSDVVHFTTSILTATISEGGNPYIDFAAGDYIEVTWTGGVAAEDAWMVFDIQENYAA